MYAYLVYYILGFVMIPGMMISMFSAINAKTLAKRIGSYSIALGSCLIPLVLNLFITKKKESQFMRFPITY